MYIGVLRKAMLETQVAKIKLLFVKAITTVSTPPVRYKFLHDAISLSVNKYPA